MKIHITIVPELLASWLFGCAPTATFTQSSSLPAGTDSTPTATPRDPEHPISNADKLAVQARGMMPLQARVSSQGDEYQMKCASLIATLRMPYAI